MEKIKFPKFAWIGGKGKCAMRLCTNEEARYLTVVNTRISKPYYWRDAGNWGTFVTQKDGKLVTCDNPTKDFGYLNNMEVIECTKKEWKKDNKGYV